MGSSCEIINQGIFHFWILYMSGFKKHESVEVLLVVFCLDSVGGCFVFMGFCFLGG